MRGLVMFTLRGLAEKQASELCVCVIIFCVSSKAPLAAAINTHIIHTVPPLILLPS